MLDASLSPARRAASLYDVPGLNDDLVHALDVLYPERCPDATDDEREIWMYAGARGLVRKLIIIRDQQRKRAVEHFDHDNPNLPYK